MYASQIFYRPSDSRYVMICCWQRQDRREPGFCIALGMRRRNVASTNDAILNLGDELIFENVFKIWRLTTRVYLRACPGLASLSCFLGF